VRRRVEEAPRRIHLSSMHTTAAIADLFDAPRLPPGLDYRPEFLDRCRESFLLDVFASLPFREAPFRQYTARRRVVRFGSADDAAASELQHGGPLPPWLAALRRDAAAVADVDNEAFVHALVTEYRPGTPIGWHRDAPDYGTVVGISIGSACRMRFRPLARRHDRGAVIGVELASRSLYVMRGDVRWRWQHHIPPVKALRYSVTFRTRSPTTSGSTSGSQL
jgi:alkylated DNA repair dioxygenase AlkB